MVEHYQKRVIAFHDGKIVRDEAKAGYILS